MNLKERAKQIKLLLPALFLAIKRKDTPLLAKILAVITVGYALSPIDLIPDFIPILGYLDDLILLPVLITFTIKFIPPKIMEECIVDAEGIWKDHKPKNRVFAIPIVLLWLLLLWVLFKALL